MVTLIFKKSPGEKLDKISIDELGWKLQIDTCRTEECTDSTFYIPCGPLLYNDSTAQLALHRERAHCNIHSKYQKIVCGLNYRMITPILF